MRSIKTIQDVVDWGLCMGCGACVSACERDAVRLENFESIGIRPRFDLEKCSDCTECLDFCPGCRIDASINPDMDDPGMDHNLLIGRTLQIWEGHAADEELRFRGSSGGALSALALYCLEVEQMEFVLHTGMQTDRPWLNTTVQSRCKEELVARAGSRYTTSSPCDSLRSIEQSPKPCVFIGKPCDAAAVQGLRRKRPNLDEKLGLVLTFFCAGTPSTRATLDLLKTHQVDLEQIGELYYRGFGWPGGFAVGHSDKEIKQLLPYREAWGILQRSRCFRCQLCPNGLGDMGDIACGDAWHRYIRGSDDPGLSLVLARTVLGRELIQKAEAAGYLKLKPSSPSEVIKAQGLTERKTEIFGRQLAMRMLLIPTTRFNGFDLFRCWMSAPLIVKIKSVLGTMRRLLQRGLWHKNRLKKTV